MLCIFIVHYTHIKKYTFVDLIFKVLTANYMLGFYQPLNFLEITKI